MSLTKETQDIFVLGLDDLNKSKLQSLDLNPTLSFVPLLNMESVTSSEDYDVQAALQAAENQLRAHPRPVAGIIGYWDFPVSLMLPILASRLGLTAPAVSAVLGCEHKYWSRVLQKEIAPEHVPIFQSLDSFDEQALNSLQALTPSGSNR